MATLSCPEMCYHLVRTRPLCKDRRRRTIEPRENGWLSEHTMLAYLLCELKPGTIKATSVVSRGTHSESGRLLTSRHGWRPVEESVFADRAVPLDVLDLHGMLLLNGGRVLPVMSRMHERGGKLFQVLLMRGRNGRKRREGQTARYHSERTSSGGFAGAG